MRKRTAYYLTRNEARMICHALELAEDQCKNLAHAGKMRYTEAAMEAGDYAMMRKRFIDRLAETGGLPHHDSDLARIFDGPRTHSHGPMVLCARPQR